MNNKELELLPQEEFRDWFKAHFPNLDNKLNRLFEDFNYDKSYRLTKLEK